MKKIVSLIFVFGMILTVSSCEFVEDIIDPTNTITYFFSNEENEARKTLEVKKGEHFELEIPEDREGYEFLGYYNTEELDEDSIRYTKALGESISTWELGEDITLYGLWKPIEITIVIDLMGGNLYSGERTYEVEYNDNFPNIVLDVRKFGVYFLGLNTKSDGSGEFITDENGVINDKLKIDSENFDISDTNEIELYAIYGED